MGRLAGRLGRSADVQEDPDLAAEMLEWFNAVSAYYLTPGSPPGGRPRRWSIRWIIAFAALQEFDSTLEQASRPLLAGKPTNVELKILVRPRIEAMLSPAVMTDRDALMIFDDATAGLRWGVWFQGPQYLTLFERWFDDLWATIPDRYLIYSRNGFSQSAVDLIRKELGALESAPTRQTA
jgi:hypothetical protein